MADDRENLVVVTAAHCLPHLPPADPCSYSKERTYRGLLGLLGDEPTIAAEVLFEDRVADIAILGTPDSQELWEQAKAYDTLIESIPPLPMAKLEFAMSMDCREAEAEAWLLALDGEWLSCRVICRRGIWTSNANKTIIGGMSGSPVMVQHGVIGVLSVSTVGDAGNLKFRNLTPELVPSSTEWGRPR